MSCRQGDGGLPGAGDFVTGHNPVERPQHYLGHPSGIECIQVVEHMPFCLGNVVKYVWRADLKGGIEDLRKARWYLDREIARRERSSPADPPESRSD